MAVHVEGAKAMPEHRDLQVRFSHLSAEAFGRIVADATRPGGDGPDFGRLGSGLAGWLARAPFLNERGQQGVDELREYLAGLREDLACAIRTALGER